jgi:hypothetical protein
MIESNLDENQKFFGFPLHLKNQSHTEIWEEIKRTQFFIDMPFDTELILSVAIFNYSSFISTWAFVGYIINDFSLTVN